MSDGCERKFFITIVDDDDVKLLNLLRPPVPPSFDLPPQSPVLFHFNFFLLFLILYWFPKASLEYRKVLEKEQLPLIDDLLSFLRWTNGETHFLIGFNRLSLSLSYRLIRI